MSINKVFLVIRTIARSTDIRSAVASVIPPYPCSNSLVVVTMAINQPRNPLYLACCFSSFVLDFSVRQKLGGANMNLFIIKQLPVLSPDQYRAQCSWSLKKTVGDWISPRALELIYTAWDLEPFANDCGYDGPPFCWNEERRFLLRCELDAAYFHLYGIERDDADYIMETFRVWKEREEKQYSEYRTKRVILEIYDEMQKAIEIGERYQTRLDPPPADPSVSHSSRAGISLR